MPTTIESIRAKFRKRKRARLPNTAGTEFAIYMSACYDLALKSYETKFKEEKHLKFKNPERIVVSNFIVNCVSALETYFKNTILQNARWYNPGLTSLLKEKITLGEAYEMFGQEKISREYIVSHYISLQNFESISAIFSKLTNTDFFKEVESFKVDWDGQMLTLLEELPDWRSEIIQLYDVRNRYVHDNVIERLSKRDIPIIFDRVYAFQIYIEEWVESKYSLIQQYEARLTKTKRIKNSLMAKPLKGSK